MNAMSTIQAFRILDINAPSKWIVVEYCEPNVWHFYNNVFDADWGSGPDEVYSDSNSVFNRLTQVM